MCNAIRAGQHFIQVARDDLRVTFVSRMRDPFPWRGNWGGLEAEKTSDYTSVRVKRVNKPVTSRVFALLDVCQGIRQSNEEIN